MLERHKRLYGWSAPEGTHRLDRLPYCPRRRLDQLRVGPAQGTRRWGQTVTST